MRFLIFVLLPVLACSVKSFVIEPEDEIINSYKSARALLTPEQEEFLMELLAADDALIEAATTSMERGIVDDILQAISGAGNGNIRVNIIGGSTQQQQQQPTNNSPASAPNPVTLINPSFTLVSGSRNPSSASNSAAASPVPATGQQEKALYNATESSTPSTPSAAASAPQSSPQNNIQMPQMTISLPQMISSLFTNGTSYQMTSSSVSSNTTTIGGSNNHLFSTISQVIMNSSRRNVTGIVDESLRIATPAPIREFVTGILQVVYCNGIRRLLGRC